MSIPPARKEQAPQGREDQPSVEPERGVQEPRSRLRMPGWLRWALITLTLGLLAVATLVAQRQAPHPDMFRPVADWDIGKADWWAYPLERNAFKRRVVRGNLAAVFVLPSTQKIWAVGRGGLVLHSADGGSNWVQQRPAVTARAADGGRQAGASAWSPFSEALAEQPDPRQQAAPNLAVQQKPDSPPLPEVAANPKAQAVNPGRLPDSRPKAEPAAAKPLANARAPTPAELDAEIARAAAIAGSPPIGPGPDGANLEAVFFATERLGWAVGEDGTILATGDGGKTWTPQTSGTKALLNSVHFTADGQRGGAVGGLVGEGWTILATLDGGKTWTPQTSGTSASLDSVHFTADGQRGWAVGANGMILATGDGGNKWTPQASGTAASLTSVNFTADGQRGWAVGDDGTILATGDGGNTWTPQTRDTRAQLYSVHFAADGQRGWAVGANGTILATGDGGNTWTPQASGTGASLTSVHFTADGQRGWAVGAGGPIVATGDGGRLWSALAPYQRYWAPWYLATLALLAFTLFLLLGLVETAQPGSDADTGPSLADGAATLLRSDQPVADKLFDRLGVRPAVEALSSFIRNRDTEPRVTIAVTDEWGSGKRSVMRILQTELEHAGFRTAWFNAWHHQQEGRQLTALFEAVRKQAVPRWWRQPVSALRVRSRLIWGRGGFYRSVAVATALLAALLAGDLLAEGWRSARSPAAQRCASCAAGAADGNYRRQSGQARPLRPVRGERCLGTGDEHARVSRRRARRHPGNYRITARPLRPARLVHGAQGRARSPGALLLLAVPPAMGGKR